MTDKLHEAVGIVLEGFTIPDAVRKILETVYYAEPKVPEGWYSVKALVPEHDQTVAVLDADNKVLKVWPAQWDAENQCFTAGNYPSAGWFEKDEISYWTPLPCSKEALASVPIDDDWHDVEKNAPTVDGYYMVTVATDDGPEVHILEFQDGRFMHEGEPTYCHGYYFEPKFWKQRPEPAHVPEHEEE